jgi:hypothetical protein
MISVWTAILGFLLTSGLFAMPAQAAILYVDKDNACPGSGTSASPYCSIQNAVNAVNSGDTIRIRDSATPYNETIQTSKSGTSGSPITVEPDTGHKPILRNTGAGGQCATFDIVNGWWTIQNLNFDATGVNPCKFGAIWARALEGIKILNNTFKGWGGPTGEPSATAMNAVIVTGGIGGPNDPYFPTNYLLDGNVFDSNRTYALVVSHTGGVTISNNEFKNTKCGRGQDAVNQVDMHVIFTAKNLIIRGNDFHDHEDRSNCTLTSQQYATEAAIWCDVGQWTTGLVTNNLIEKNKIWNIQKNKTDFSNPNGLSHASRGIFIEAKCAGYTVQNNVIWDVGNIGITNSYHSLDVNAPVNKYYNNTIHSNGVYGINIKFGNVEVKNNIISSNGTAQICRGACSEDGNTSQVSLVADYNLYDDAGSQTNIGRVSNTTYNFADWKKQCGCDSHSVNTNPLFVNPPLDFHLQSSSPARGAGEGGIDMGAYPYISNQTLSSPTNLQIVPN